MTIYFISTNAHERVKTYLRGKGELVDLGENSNIDSSISAHPDLQLVNIKDKLIVAPNGNLEIISWLRAMQLPFVFGEKHLCSPYPGHISYNVVVLEHYLLHHLKHTDASILKIANENDLKPIHIQQGYSKCSTVVVDGCSIITSDMGIKKAVSCLPIDCLLVEEGFVSLVPFSHGFLGGASGKVGDELIWNGSLENHPNRESIRTFVKSKGIKNVEFEGLPLVDIGSILEWKVD